MKKRVISIAAILVAVVLVLGVVLAANHEIGLTKGKLEQDMRQSQNIGDEWSVAGVAGSHMAAFVAYPDTKDDHVFSIYVNRPGLSFGYFFRGGGTLSEIDRSIIEVQLEGCKEHAYLSMNHAGVVRVELDNGNNVQTVELQPDEPFVMVVPNNAGTVTFYDANDAVVEPSPATI